MQRLSVSISPPVPTHSERRVGSGRRNTMEITGNGGRPIGLPKTGGRKKGTPNRATLTLQEVLDHVGCDPLLELATIAMTPQTPIDLRVRCLSEIAPYVYPRRKPV